MRIHVSLLAFCVALAGCKSSVDSANIDTVMVYSNPTAAAVRVNGDAVGRTPTTIKLDRTKNYELQVGKGGYLTETSELKPRLITTSEGIEFGFPAAVKVNLTKIPAEGEAGVPAADNPEFRRLSKKALGEEAAAKESLQSDIAATKEAAVKIQAALAAREAAAQARLAEISKSIAAAKAAKGKDEAAKAKLAEAELALAQATAEAEAARKAAEKNLKSVEARAAALAAPQNKVAQAKAVVVQAKAAAVSGEDRLGKLEQTYAAEMKSLKDSQANAAIAIKALSARADELNRRSSSNVKAVTADGEKSLAQAKQEIAAQKAAAAKAKLDADAKLAAATKAAEKKLAEANKAAAAAKAQANKAAAVARLDAEAKLAEANKAAAAAKAQAAALKYSEFSSRYALLESKRRAKAISEEDFKAALSGLRKELGL
jgi:colicin import membrane protein